MTYPAVTGEKKNKKKTSSVSVERPGQVLFNMLGRKTNYDDVSHQTLDGPKKRGMWPCVCVSEKVPKNTLYEHKVQKVVTWTHKKTSFAERAGSCC